MALINKISASGVFVNGRNPHIEARRAVAVQNPDNVPKENMFQKTEDKILKVEALVAAKNALTCQLKPIKVLINVISIQTRSGHRFYFYRTKVRSLYCIENALENNGLLS